VSWYIAACYVNLPLSRFVLHALVLTFVTTPLVELVYPARFRSLPGASVESGIVGAPGATHGGDTGDDMKSRFAVILDKLEHLPAAMTFAQLVKGSSNGSSSTINVRGDIDEKIEKGSTDDSLPEVSAVSYSQHISIDALRIIELTERTSAVLKSQSADVLMRQDPVLSVMRTFSQLNQFSVSTSLAVIPVDEYANSVATHARKAGSQMIVVPWTVTPDISDVDARPASPLTPSNPFDQLFRKNAADAVSSVAASHVIRRIFLNSPTDVALFIDRGLPLTADGLPHLFLPFFGGPDDRLALSLVAQFCRNPGITATVIRVRKTDSAGADASKHDAQLTYGNVSYLAHA